VIKITWAALRTPPPPTFTPHKQQSQFHCPNHGSTAQSWEVTPSVMPSATAGCVPHVNSSRFDNLSLSGSPPRHPHQLAEEARLPRVGKPIPVAVRVLLPRGEQPHCTGFCGVRPKV